MHIHPKETFSINTSRKYLLMIKCPMHNISMTFLTFHGKNFSSIIIFSFDSNSKGMERHELALEYKRIRWCEGLANVSIPRLTFNNSQCRSISTLYGNYLIFLLIPVIHFLINVKTSTSTLEAR